VVQRILGHSSPTVTAGVYGHLDVEDMRAGLEQLSFQPTEEPLAEVLPLAVGGPHGAPVVRNVVRAVAPPMLTVREVAAELAVCRATVYAILERGELERVWVGRSIRIPAASLEALLSRGRR
jgi:excisionase family DNA binding protein